MKLNITKEQLAAAEILWNYHFRCDQLTSAKLTSNPSVEFAPAQQRIILGLGSYDLRVAEYCAQLYHAGIASRIIFSGKEGNWTAGSYTTSEAFRFANCAEQTGVPRADLLLEEQATNLGENIAYSRSIISQLTPAIHEVVVVTKPNTCRRAYATFKRTWPEMAVKIAAPELAFANLAAGKTLADLLSELAGDLARILDYPARGFQIPQAVPAEVLQAYHVLCAGGYAAHPLPSRTTVASD